jgi:molybdopterin-guanine dinucleotide biosynthesis protein MobB
MLYELRAPGVEHLISLAAEDVDIVLVEGFKSGPFRKIEVFNPDLYGTPLCIEEPDDSIIAIVSREYIDAGVPWFSFDDLSGIIDCMERLGTPPDAEAGLRKGYYS